MKRLAIIGSPGSGKTTLSNHLGKKLSLPVIHLDLHFWHKNWQPKNIEKWPQMVEELTSQEKWIIDGDYFNTMDIRLEAADTIVFLNLPLRVCLWRIIKRMLLSHGKVRSDMPDDCKEKFSWQFFSFFKFVLDYHRRKKSIILGKLKNYQNKKKVIILSSQKAIDEMMA